MIGIEYKNDDHEHRARYNNKLRDVLTQEEKIDGWPRENIRQTQMRKKKTTQHIKNGLTDTQTHTSI